MKRIGTVFGFVFVLCAAMGFAACSQKVSDSDSSGGAEETKAKILIAGQTADEEGIYSLTLGEEAKGTYTLVVGTLTDYAFTVAVTDTKVVSASVTETTLTLEALSAGSTSVTISESSEKAEDVNIRVTVTAKGEETVAPTGLSVSNLADDSGAGEADDPYSVKFSAGKQSVHSLVVRPSDADKAFTWTVGTLSEGTFTENSGLDLTAEQSGNTLTLSSSTAGEYALRGKANTGDLTVYFRVTVEEYTELTGITANLPESEEEGYDYYFKTAKGTSWNMTDGMAGRGEALLNGSVMGGAQAPLNLTYYASLYKMTFTPVPAEATDTTWTIQADKEGIFTLSPDGNWTANAAGTAVLTVSNTSGEAEIKIKVEVVDTLYNGVLKSEFDSMTADTEVNWNFDSNPDDLDYTKGLLGDWRLVMNKTTANPDGDDGNQKIFYLGTADRIYGVCLETRIDSSTGLSAGEVTALTWTKAHIPATATTMTVAIGNNDKTFGSYRITLVKADGTAKCVTDGWVLKSKPLDDGKPYAEYQIPDDFKDSDVAIVIETSLAQTDNNCELHFKGLWINSYKAVESVSLASDKASVGQGGTYTINATVTPFDASYKTLTYTLADAPEGGEDGIAISSAGVISIATDAPVGEYKIVVASTDNPKATAEFTLTVTQYTALTKFDGGLYLGEREIHYGTDTLSGAAIAATFDEDGIYTDKALGFRFTANENASVTTYKVAMGTDGVVAFENGEFSFIGAGTTTVTITPDDNPDLAISFTVTVSAYNADESLIAGTNVTKTSAAMLSADDSASWTNAAGLKKFVFNTVDKRHSNAKWNTDGDAIQFENHVVQANSQNPVNIGYNLISVGKDMKYLNFKVHGHSDDRYLESSNIRVRVAYLEGENWTVDMLLDWTTIANRWKQKEEWYTLSLDVSAYAGRNILVLFEMVGGLQNNGNYPKDSDSAAGGYLYLSGITLSAEMPEGAIPAPDGEVEADYNTYRMYANASLAADGWTVSASGKGGDGKGSYTAEGVYAPLTLTYTGSLSEKVSLQLTTTTFYSNTTAAALYPWGVFPALNNGETGEIQLSSSDETIFTVANGAITPVKNGTAKLLVKALAYGSSDKYVTFEVTVTVSAVETAVTANETAATIEAGGSYTFDYYTIPAEQETQFSVTAKPETATDASYTLADGKFTAAENAPLGDYTVRISLKASPEVYCEVKITVAKVTSWENKAAILDEYTGWKITGDWDSGVGEGADIRNTGYLSKTVDLTGLKTLTVNARVFVRENETNPKMYVAVMVDGQAVRIRAAGATEDTVELDTTDEKYNTPQAYTYDLSAYAGKKIEIRIGVDQGSHCVITSIALS